VHILFLVDVPSGSLTCLELALKEYLMVLTRIQHIFEDRLTVYSFVFVRGCTIWLIGLSRAGKSTIAMNILRRFPSTDLECTEYIRTGLQCTSFL
jgi:ABC-type microcin C transport system duplicated ATPase subunit YejF